MSIIIGAAVFVVGVCVGGVIMGLLAAGGRDERRVEVRDALQEVYEALNEACCEAADVKYALLDEDVAVGFTAIHRSLERMQRAQTWFARVAELLDMRSVVDSWTSDTANAPVVNTGDGGTGSDAPATALHENGTVGVAAGSYVKQSIASR